jgi:protein-tyrosine phosphatase
MRRMLQTRGLEHLFEVSSAGTGNWHVGEPPDQRATEAARTRGYDMSDLRAKQIVERDFRHYDLILAMDRSNIVNMRRICPSGCLSKISLLMDYVPQASVDEVPDPYYGGEDGFSLVLNLLEDACENLINTVCSQKRIGA